MNKVQLPSETNALILWLLSSHDTRLTRNMLFHGLSIYESLQPLAFGVQDAVPRGVGTIERR